MRQFIQDPVYILAFLCFIVFLSEWICKKSFLKHFGSSLMAILITAIVANLGLLPSASNASPVYGHIFSYIAPIGIFYLLLSVNLKDLKKAGLPMLIMFIIGSLSTVVGVTAALYLVDGPTLFGEKHFAIAGMMTGTYTGGSVNFNAVALHYDVVKEGVTYTGIVVTDNILTALWMIAGLVLPKYMQKLLPKNKRIQEDNVSDSLEGTYSDSEQIDPGQLGLLLVLGLSVLIISDQSAAWFASRGISVPSILILTTIALVLAQLPVIQKLKGAKLLGMFNILLFLAVVGAFCEISAIGNLGELALTIIIFTSSIILVHGITIFLIGHFIKQDWDIVVVASQANIGGPSTALALAKSLKRPDLLLPAILVGTLGSALGTYLGFMVAEWLK
ncbi:MAG: DUF819 family protein [Bacteroidota bacterium]